MTIQAYSSLQGSHFLTVVCSAIHLTSIQESSAVQLGIQKSKLFLAGSLILNPAQVWMTACPSANENPAAPL